MSKTRFIGSNGAPRASRPTRTLLISMLLLGTAGVAAPEEATGDSLPRAHIAMINASQLFAESLLGKDYAARIQELENEIETVRQGRETEATQRSSELATLKEELQAQASSLSPDERDDKSLEIRRKERELQVFIEDGQDEIQQMRQRVQREVQKLQAEYKDKMRPHIESVAREKGLDFLIDSAVTLPLTSTYDISKDVIARADAAQQAGE
jgi:Skp family chaperone for outer membrane proteins